MDLKKICNVIKEVLIKKKEIIASYLYGSILHSDNFEDIDIGILTSYEFKPNDVLYESQISGIIEKAIYKVINIYKPVDIRVLNEKPLRFLNSILKNSILIHSNDDNKRAQFETKVTKEYLDIKPHHDYYDKIRELKYIDR